MKLIDAFLEAAINAKTANELMEVAKLSKAFTAMDQDGMTPKQAEIYFGYIKRRYELGHPVRFPNIPARRGRIVGYNEKLSGLYPGARYPLNIEVQEGPLNTIVGVFSYGESDIELYRPDVPVEPKMLYVMSDGHHCVVSVKDPESTDYEEGKSEFSVPHHPSQRVYMVNTIATVLRMAGVNVHVVE